MTERDAAVAQPERSGMRGPHRFVVRMIIFLLAVIGLAYALGGPLLAAFMGNPAVNGVILGILSAGIIYIFRQVLLLGPASAWIDNFRERLADRDLTAPPGPAPRLVAPMARMLGRRQSGRVSLSATSLQTLLDGIASRLEENPRDLALSDRCPDISRPARNILRAFGDGTLGRRRHRRAQCRGQAISRAPSPI